MGKTQRAGLLPVQHKTVKALFHKEQGNKMVQGARSSKATAPPSPMRNKVGRPRQEGPAPVQPTPVQPAAA